MNPGEDELKSWTVIFQENMDALAELEDGSLGRITLRQKPRGAP